MSAKRPKVSVLMPVYNGEKYLREAIESILNQSFKDFEFLIINDGSTDSSKEIINSYKDCRIKSVDNEKNLGIAQTLNKGIDLAQGKYIARMDCDDISTRNRLKLQVKYMDSHPEIGVCGAWTWNIGGRRGVLKAPVMDEYIKAFLVIDSPFAHPTVIFRKSVLIKYNLKYRSDYVVEDYGLWLDCVNNIKMHNLPQYLLKYRVIETSLSRSIERKEKYNASRRVVIKRALLEIMNIDASDRQLEMHLGDCVSINKYNITIDEIHNWLEYIYQSNKKLKKFSDDAVKAALSYRWYEACNFYSKHGMKTYIIFFRSKFNCLKYRPWHAVRLLIKCIIHK